jgi:hypothetical protein
LLVLLVALQVALQVVLVLVQVPAVHILPTMILPLSVPVQALIVFCSFFPLLIDVDAAI